MEGIHCVGVPTCTHAKVTSGTSIPNQSELSSEGIHPVMSAERKLIEAAARPLCPSVSQ